MMTASLKTVKIAEQLCIETSSGLESPGRKALVQPVTEALRGILNLGTCYYLYVSHHGRQQNLYFYINI